MDKNIIIQLSAKYAAGFAANAISAAIQKEDADTAKETNCYDLSLYENSSEADEYIKFEIGDTTLKFGSMLLGDNSGIFAPLPQIIFDRSKRLIETEVSGNESIVVERWNTNQWDLTISGSVIDTNNRHYPEAKISELNKLFKYDGIVKVSGRVFYDKDIESIYFKSVHIESAVGFEDTVNYRLTAKSIKELGFSLLENE